MAQALLNLPAGSLYGCLCHPTSRLAALHVSKGLKGQSATHSSESALCFVPHGTFVILTKLYSMTQLPLPC